MTEQEKRRYFKNYTKLASCCFIS